MSAVTFQVSALSGASSRLAIARGHIQSWVKYIWQSTNDQKPIHLSEDELKVLLSATDTALHGNEDTLEEQLPNEIFTATTQLLNPNQLRPVIVSAAQLDPSRSIGQVIDADPRLIITDCSEQVGRQLRDKLRLVHCASVSSSMIQTWQEQMQLRDAWLTVIIPTMGEIELTRSIYSLLNQTEASFGVIIISGEASGDTARRLAPLQLDERFLLIECTDDGPYDAMNLGHLVSSTEWTYVLGSGDVIATPEVFSKIRATCLQRTTADIIYGNVLMRGDGPGTYDGQTYAWSFDYERLRTSTPCHQAIFYRRESVMASGAYNPTYKICADWDLNLRLWKKSEPLFVELTVAEFYRGGLSSTHIDEAFFADLPEIWLQNA